MAGEKSEQKSRGGCRLCLFFYWFSSAPAWNFIMLSPRPPQTVLISRPLPSLRVCSCLTTSQPPTISTNISSLGNNKKVLSASFAGFSEGTCFSHHVASAGGMGARSTHNRVLSLPCLCAELGRAPPKDGYIGSGELSLSRHSFEDACSGGWVKVWIAPASHNPFLSKAICLFTWKSSPTQWRRRKISVFISFPPTGTALPATFTALRNEPEEWVSACRTVHGIFWAHFHDKTKSTGSSHGLRA